MPRWAAPADKASRPVTSKRTPGPGRLGAFGLRCYLGLGHQRLGTLLPVRLDPALGRHDSSPVTRACPRAPPDAAPHRVTSLTSPPPTHPGDSGWKVWKPPGRRSAMLAEDQAGTELARQGGDDRQGESRMRPFESASGSRSKGYEKTRPTGKHTRVCKTACFGWFLQTHRCRVFTSGARFRVRFGELIFFRRNLCGRVKRIGGYRRLAQQAA